MHPLLVYTDSKVVTDPVNFIKTGRYSASSRINRFITNINKVNLEVKHMSGKARLSQGSSEVCKVCIFLKDKADTVLNPPPRTQWLSCSLTRHSTAGRCGRKCRETALPAHEQ